MSERVVNGQNSDRQDRTQGSNESSMQAASRQHRRQVLVDHSTIRSGPQRQRQRRHPILQSLNHAKAKKRREARTPWNEVNEAGGAGGGGV